MCSVVIGSEYIVVSKEHLQSYWDVIHIHLNITCLCSCSLQLETVALLFTNCILDLGRSTVCRRRFTLKNSRRQRANMSNFS